MAKVVYFGQETIAGHTATFLFVKSFDTDERVSKIRDYLADNSWISNASPYLQDSYQKRIDTTLEHFDSAVASCQEEEELLSFIGEKIVTVGSNEVIEEKLKYEKKPLGDSFKSRVDGNGGFDFYNENLIDFYIVFGEGKYVKNNNPFYNALSQIVKFKSEGKDSIDLPDLDQICDTRSLNNFSANGVRAYAAGFSFFSNEDKIPQIIEHIKNNDDFKALISLHETIIVGVVF